MAIAPGATKAATLVMIAAPIQRAAHMDGPVVDL